MADIRKWLKLALQFVPLVLAAKGVPDTVIEPIAAAVVESEQFEGATGAEKKAHVLNIAKDAIAAVNGAAGKQKIDPAIVVPLVSDGIDLGVRTVNQVHRATTEPNQLNVPHPEPGLSTGLPKTAPPAPAPAAASTAAENEPLVPEAPPAAPKSKTKTKKPSK